MPSDDSANPLKHLCEEFESDWLNDRRPFISDYLEHVAEPQRERLSELLIPIDVLHRLRSGETVSPHDYRALGQNLVSVAWAVLKEINSYRDSTIADGAKTPVSLDFLETLDHIARGVVNESTKIQPGKSIQFLSDGLPANQQFGDYELIEEIARGGMGVVYKARQSKLKRIVALKMILAGQLAGEDEIRRFYSEAESAAALEHAGIVPIYEVGCVGDQHFFSMAFIEGQSLASVVQQGPLSAQRAADFVAQIADAISYAHSKNVIHRDLKPANVLLDENGRIKVTDFGLAKQLKQDTGLTATGQVMGTPGYMPPEQATGNQSLVDETSDVYSIGALLYCLLTGRPPFQAATPLETIAQVIDQDPVEPRLLVPGLPRDLETICLKCLEKEQHRRYQSTRELKEELNRFEVGLPIRARPISNGERIVRWMRRRSQLLKVAVLAGLAVALVLAISLIARFAYQQSLLGYVDFRTNEEEGYLVATILDEQERPIERHTLPTQEPIALPEGSYRVRVSGARTLSKDIWLDVERGSRRQPYSPEMTLKDTELWPNIQTEAKVEFVTLKRNADAILIDAHTVSRRDGGSGKLVWQTNVSEAVDQFDAPPRFRWWSNFGSKINGYRQESNCPKLLQPPVDLDADGIADLVFAGSEQAWLLALSGEDGAPLWFQQLATENEQHVSNYGSILLNNAIVHKPFSIHDLDHDNVAEILTIVFRMNDDRQQAPQRWLELTSGKTGIRIWTAELKGSWFDETDVPLDFRWFHSGYSVSSTNDFSLSSKYIRDRGTITETGANFYMPSPIIECHFDASPFVLIAGDQLVRVQIETGMLESTPLGFKPIKSPEVADLNGDGDDELVFIVEADSTPVKPTGQNLAAAQKQPTELIVWSLAGQKIAWRTKLFSKWGAVRKLGKELANWPQIVDLNGDGQQEIIVPDETTYALAPTSVRGKPFGGLSTFDSNGNLIWKQKLVSPREQLDRFLVGPDINDDGFQDLFVVTGNASDESWNRKTIWADCISGIDGSRIWHNQQVLRTPSHPHNYGETLRWWNPGNDGWPQLLVGLDSDLFAFSPRTGLVTGFGHYIDTVIVADGDGDDSDDLFFLRKDNLGSYRGRPQVNWTRSPMKVTRSADVNSDGIEDVALGTSMISGRDGTTLWKSDLKTEPQSQSVTERIFVLDHDCNQDGANDVLAPTSWSRGNRTFARLLSGVSGKTRWSAKGEFSADPVWSANLIHVTSHLDTAGIPEITVAVSESREEFNGSYYSMQSGHTWLVRLNGVTGATKWKEPIFEGEYAGQPFGIVVEDLNNDGVKDVLTPARAITESDGSITNGLLQLRALNGTNGSLMWSVPIVQLDEHNLSSFPILEVVKTGWGGVIVTMFDHGKPSTNLRIVEGETGRSKTHLLNWTAPMPQANINKTQLPRPVVIQNRLEQEAFVGVSVWTDQPTVKNDWKGETLEKGFAEEFILMNMEGEVVTRFGLPRVHGNSFPPNQQRLWSFDVDQDGIDELILLDQTGLTAINPFQKLLIWKWERPQSLNLRLHSLRQPGQPTVGVVTADREIFGIDLSTGRLVWRASDKSDNQNYFAREEIYLLNCAHRSPRALLMNDNDTVCVTTRPESFKLDGDPLPVPIEHMAKNDPKNLRLLPWVEGSGFADRPDALNAFTEELIRSLVCLPMLILFLVVPWFWFKRIFRRRRFSIRSLLALFVLLGFATLFFTPDRGLLPEQFKFSYDKILFSIVVLPPMVFSYSLIRMSLSGEWKQLKAVGAVLVTLAVGFSITALAAANSFAPEESYSYAYAWILFVYLAYIIGVLLIVFELTRICRALWKVLWTKMRRNVKHSAVTS